MKPWKLVDLFAAAMVIAVAMVLWILILIAVAHFFGCSITFESGIHDSMRADDYEHRATPTPTPMR